MTEPNSSSWDLPPTLSKKFDLSNDLVTLTVTNLNANKGTTVKTGRPFVLAIRLMRAIIPEIRSSQMNDALANLQRGGACVVERLDPPDVFRTDIEVRSQMFMFYLSYEGEPDLMYDGPHEVDAKLAMFKFEEFGGRILVEPKTTTPVADKFSAHGFHGSI
jgi:hypothetical protein